MIRRIRPGDYVRALHRGMVTAGYVIWTNATSVAVRDDFSHPLDRDIVTVMRSEVTYHREAAQ